ncbi:MAG TPA: zinc-binding alcohol dehydrogenase family protein [Thermomicrobiales bacterium]
MREAVTLAPHRVELREVTEPRPGAGEALIRIERVGICGSDVHLYHGAHPYATYPRVQGHEAAGRIVAFGTGYEGELGEGERVSIEPLIPCGDCYPCRLGRRNCCVKLKVLGAHVDGTFREYVSVPFTMIYASGDLTAEQAALVEPVSIGVQAVHRGAIVADEQVLVVGAGPIGAGIALAAVDRGARVMVADRLASRLDLVRHLGVERTVDASSEDVGAAVRDWTGGDGAHVAIDAVGAPAVIRQCAELVASAGRVVIVGLSMQEVSLPVIGFTRKEMTILGSRNNAGLFGEAVALVGRHREQLTKMITHRYPLEELPAALQLAAEHPEQVEKVMIEVAGGT